MTSISRKEFLRLSAAGLGALVGGRLLAACGQATPSTQPPTATAALPTATLTDTAIPTATVAAITSTPRPIRRPEVIKFYPDVPSRVVRMHHAGVWQGDTLQPEALQQMLDASVTRLTGLNDAVSAWKVLFDPSEKVAIKVNCLPFGRYWTHVPLVAAVADRLQAAGVPAEQIIVFDRFSSDLTKGEFTINQDGPGVRYYGTDGHHAYNPAWKIAGTTIGFSQILLGCDALIDMPILKTHSIDGAGMSFALKNHYGSMDQPQYFHLDKLLQAIPDLNALAPIKDRTRLVIGDGLKVIQDNWNNAFDGDSIFMSFDPVAHDTVGLNVLTALQDAAGLQSAPIRERASKWLKNSADLGVGTDQLANIDLVEETIYG